MTREVAFDTETTGIKPQDGHRIVEIGCVELLNRVPTGRVFQTYLNPERDMPPDAERIHGLSRAFLADKPLFKAVAAGFLAFIGDDPVVAHNASFDLGFINNELKLAGEPLIAPSRMVDTLALARRKHPGAPASLDALCARYGIDNSKRAKHGALLDAEILAEVYCELTGGRQSGLSLSVAAASGARKTAAAGSAPGARPEPLSPRLTSAERTAHAEFIKTLGPDAHWGAYVKA